MILVDSPRQTLEYLERLFKDTKFWGSVTIKVQEGKPVYVDITQGVHPKDLGGFGR